jgi:hypothetical protein
MIFQWLSNALNRRKFQRLHAEYEALKRRAEEQAKAPPRNRRFEDQLSDDVPPRTSHDDWL